VHAVTVLTRSHHVQTLVASLAQAVTPALTSMQKMPWGQWSTVGDTSDYVVEMVQV
jgi:hypothetical protein